MRATAAVLAVALVAALAVGVGVGAAAHEEPDRTLFAAELDADGDAVVYNVTTYDLSEDQQRENYEAYADNETELEAWRDTVVAEMEDAAADGAAETGLDMRVHNASARVYETEDDEGNEFGRVEVRAEWDQLAFSEEHRVVVTEPFQGGYEPGPTRVALHAPEGYVRGTTLPTPLRAQADSGLWNPRTSDFSQFYAEFTDPDADADDGGDGRTDDGDGDSSAVGPLLRALLVAAVPVALVLLALRYRQS